MTSNYTAFREIYINGTIMMSMKVTSQWWSRSLVIRVNLIRGVQPPKPTMHIAYSPISTKFINSLIFVLFRFFVSPYFDHDAFTQYA